MNWLKEEVDKYYEWLKQNTFVQEDKETGWGVITLPFTGIFNDCIEIFAKRQGDNILLSDDGNTIENLKSEGVFFNTPYRRRILDIISRSFGVNLFNEEVTKLVRKEDFPQGKHDILQAIMEINDLQNLSSHSVSSLFKEDVRIYFKQNKINVTPQMMLRGKSGINFTFDYLLSNFDSECLIQAFNVLDKPRLAQFIFGMDEITDDRQKATEKTLSAVTIINDVENKPKEEFVAALKERNYKVLSWSERDTDEFKSSFKQYAA